MDAEIKEIGFIMTFALLIGFGYFNVSFDDLAFTQPAPHYRYLTAESFDVPVPEQHQIIQFGPSGEPLSWVSFYTFTEQGDPPVEFPDFIQSANAETLNRRIIIQSDRIMNAGGAGGDFFNANFTLKPCQDASGSFSGLGGYPANKRMVQQGSTTCKGYYHQNDIGQPMIPPELATNIDGFGWQARGITFPATGGGCNTDAIVGIPDTAAGQGGTMTFLQAVNSSQNTPAGPPKWSLSTSGCVQTALDFPTLIGSGLLEAGISFYRDLFETGIYPNGDPLLDATTGEGRVGMLHSVPGLPWATRGVNSFALMNQNWFFGDLSHIPTNATDGLWQIKEHSKYSAGTMDDCQFERLDDSFNIKTGTTVGEQGQCLILKTFNTDEILFEDDFTTGFAHATFDLNEWQTTFPSKFDINNATGSIEVSVSDTNDNSEGIRYFFPEIWEDSQSFVTQVSWDNAVYTNGTGQHDLFYTVAKGAVVNRLSHSDGMSFSWTVSITGEQRFITYFNNGDASQDIDDNGLFLNATDQGSAMDSGCMEMQKEGRFFTWNFFTNLSCTGTPKDTLTRTVSNAGTILDFRYPSVHYSDQLLSGTRTGSITMDVKDVKIWNGVSEVPTTVFKPDIKVEGFVNGTGSGDMLLNVAVFDGKQDGPLVYTMPQGATSFPSDFDFDENKFREDVGDGLQNFSNHRMGETEIQSSSSTPVPFTIELSPHYPSGVGEFSDINGLLTVSIGLEDNSSDGILSANITKITVGEHEYDFAKPIIYYWEQTIPASATSGCGGCVGTDTQATGPELDYGWVDANYTTVAPFVTALPLPNPTSSVTNLSADVVNSINVTWTHDGLNTTGYRIYRTSTESVDTQSFLNTGLSGSGGLALSSSPRDHISQNNFIGNGLTGKIITDVSLRCRNFNDLATGGFLQGAIFVASQTGQTTDATLANSSNTILPTSISSTEQTVGPFKFRGDGLINHTTTGLRGIGLTWANPTGGSVLCAMADTLTGGSEQSRWDAPTNWGRTNGFDLRIVINQLNQTKLSSPAVPFINDTGSLDNFFLDVATAPNESYFYQIFPLNGNQEGPSVTVVNATQPAVPGKVQNLQLSHDNVNSEHDLTWDNADFADMYTVQRLSTERQILKSDSFGVESNFWGSISNTNDIVGDDTGFVAFDIPTQTELRTARVFNGPNSPEGGQLVYGYWTNVISAGTNQIEPDYRSETEQYPGHLAGGTRLAKDCSRLSFNVEQDGMTQRSDGTWFDGNCQVENRYLGTELANLTIAETANAEVNALWRDQSEANANGIIQILRPFAGGGSGWVFQDGAPNRWFSSIGIEQKSWVMNQTWVNVTQVSTNSFSDPSNNYNSYLYRIIAENTISQEGPPSDIVNGTLSLPPLRVPDLNATDNGGTVDLEWAEAEIKFSRELSEDPVQGYFVQRATGENETVIYDGIGDAGGLNHDVEEFFLDGTGLTLITNPKPSSDRSHAGQQLNITQAVNITRIIVKMGAPGGPFNVEPDFGGSIHFANGTQITRSIMPRYSALDVANDLGFAHFVFSPPVHLEPDEYIFGWQMAGTVSCVSASCGTSVNRSYKVFFEETGVGGGSSGWAIGEDTISGAAFTDNPINGTKDKDYAMAIFGETTWETIGNTTSLNFTDSSPPVGTKAYRILAFNDAGVSHQPTLLHNPQNTTIMQIGAFLGVGDAPFKPDAQGRLRAGTLNLGEMVTFSAPSGTVPNPPTGLSATANGTDILLDWNNQGDADSFNVIRNGTTIATNVLVSEFIDLMVALGEFFSYTVVANNVNGSSSASTASIVLSNNVPSNVTGVGTMPINGLSVFIEWDDPVADRGVGSPSLGVIVEYLIFRDDVGDGDPFEFITTVAEGIGEFDDLSALGGHSYTYKILASNGIGNATGNSTTTAAVMVDNALVIRALEADGLQSLEDDAEVTIFNSTFNSGPLQTNAQGRAFLFNATGAYNFTIVFTAQNIDFLVNKTLTGVTGVVLTEDTVIDVLTNVHKVDCASNGPNNDFRILVNSTSDDHFISDFTTPVCDSEDKVSWQVQYEGLGTGGGGGSGTGNVVVLNTFTEQELDETRTGVLGGPLADSNDATIGQTVTFAGEDLTGVSVILSNTATSGNITAVLWDDGVIGVGTDVISDFTELARSDTFLISDFDSLGLNGSLNSDGTQQPFIWQFNFSGAGTTNLSGEHLIGFEIKDVAGGGTEQITQYQGLGTLGLTALYFEGGSLSNFTSVTGIIDEGVRQNGTNDDGTPFPPGQTQGEIHIGEAGDHTFMHDLDNGDDLVSVAFWIKGDVDGSAEYPILTSSSGVGSGINLHTDGNGFMDFRSFEDGADIIFQFQGGLGIPPDDGEWHLVTLTYDKSITNGNPNAIICIDGTSNCEQDTQFGSWVGGGSDPSDDPLTIGDNTHNTGGSVVENTFDVDELIIWNGYNITGTDIDNMWNSGNGSSGGGISSGNIRIYHTFDLADATIVGDGDLQIFGVDDALYDGGKPGTCWTANSVRGQLDADVVTCDNVNTALDDFRFKVFGDKDGITEQVYFDYDGYQHTFRPEDGFAGGTSFDNEGENDGGSGFFVDFGGPKATVSEMDMIGNVLPLAGDPVTKVVLPVLDCGTNDNKFTIRAVITDEPTEGIFDTPTIHAVSDIFTTPGDPPTSCDSTLDAVFSDLTFNFTSAPSLTGDYFVGFALNNSDNEKFFQAYPSIADEESQRPTDQQKPFEGCIGCVDIDPDDIVAWGRYQDAPIGGNWTSSEGNGLLDGQGPDAYSVINLVIFTEVTGGGGSTNSSFTTTMATQVLSLGDFGNNAKNFIVNGTMLNTTYSNPVITSEPIIVSTNSSNVLLTFDELFLQEQEPTDQGGSPSPPPPTTQTGGGGGVPRLDINTQLQFLEDLFGFSLFSKIHQMQIGQIQDGSIDITWNSPSPITIEAIQVGDQFVTWVGFPRSPFVIEGSDRISTGKIPYRIMPPNNLCDEVTGQTANCVDRILYEIPVKIFATVEGSPLEANTVIKVNLSLDITLALFTVFIAFVAGVGAIVYRAAIINPRQRRRSRKELKTKSNDRKQIENRFSAKKSKLRRRP